MEDLQGGTLALEHRYDLDRRVREFALVTVYRATQHPFERPVWVKVCEAPHSFAAPEVYDRIKRSVVDAAAFDHDHVPNVIDFGDIDTHLAFWVIERGEGGAALDEYLEKHGTLAPEEALEIIRRVADVVAAAHENGMVHGGIAPRWIAVRDEGVDVDHFGIQPPMHEVREMDGAILSQDLLWSFPPEQFGTEPVELNEASDIWALGVLLYWMVSGVHPYLDDPTDTSEALIRLGASAVPPLLEDLGFEPGLSEFVERALAPQPDERHTSVRNFIASLPGAPSDEVSDSVEEEELPETVAAPVSEARPQGAVGTALAGVLVLLLLSNLGWFFYTTSQEPEQARVALEPGEPEILPVGIVVDTEPPGAKVMRVDGTKEVEFGDTPFTLDPKSVDPELLPVVLRVHGHRDVRLDVEAESDGHRLTVHLPPDGEVAETEVDSD